MADLALRGQMRASAREVLGWALQTRRSFWHTARLNVVDPFVFNYRRRAGLSAPSWMAPSFAAKHGVIDRLASVRGPRAKLGKFYSTQTAVELGRVANWVQRGPFEDRLEMRYPFLSRKLVEYTLRLPVQLKVRPQGRKWVLREAMRDVMPEEVRSRTQKGGMDARVLWTLEHERPLIDALLTNPILGDLQCVNVTELKKTVDLARNGAWHNTVHVLSVLALESWLRARNDVWPVNHKAKQSAA
jgi:hypothetical protein